MHGKRFSQEAKIYSTELEVGNNTIAINLAKLLLIAGKEASWMFSSNRLVVSRNKSRSRLGAYQSSRVSAAIWK